MRRWMLTAAIAAASLATGLVAGRGALGGEDRAATDAAGFDKYHRTVFLAVLDGCFEDGVPDKLAKVMVERDEKRNAYVHLVDSCPICMPTLNAIETYLKRPSWRLKTGANTFADSVPNEVAADLGSGDRKRQFDGMQKLIERWVARRLDLLHLSAEERAEWTAAMAERRKKGMSMLGAAKAAGNAPEESECPVCNGANDATKGK